MGVTPGWRHPLSVGKQALNIMLFGRIGVNSSAGWESAWQCLVLRDSLAGSK